MKNFSFLLCLLLLTGFGCTPSQDSGGGEMADDTAADTTEQASSAETMTYDDYQVKVVDAEPASPRKELTTTIEGVDITINYGSPYAKGRDIWGGLVPYGQVWRTGANEATTFTASEDITIEGQRLAAGEYGLFTIPGEEEWTLIFNETPEQWGSNSYEAAKDALRVTVQPQQMDEKSESMEFAVDGNTIMLKWDMLAIPFEVSTSES